MRMPMRYCDHAKHLSRGASQVVRTRFGRCAMHRISRSVRSGRTTSSSVRSATDPDDEPFCEALYARGNIQCMRR